MRARIPSILLPGALAIFASLLLAAAALAAETRLSAELADAGGGDSDGSGSASITIDPETGEVCYELSVENIGDVAASHIHEGAEGEEGGVVVPLDADGFTDSSSDCLDASDADLAAIVANPADFYVNIHTADFPNGAIRGQLAAESPDTAMELPTTSSPWAAVGLLFIALATLIVLRTERRRS